MRLDVDWQGVSATVEAGHVGDELVVLVTATDSIPADVVGHYSYSPEVADNANDSPVVGHYSPEVADKPTDSPVVGHYGSEVADKPTLDGLPVQERGYYLNDRTDLEAGYLGEPEGGLGR